MKTVELIPETSIKAPLQLAIATRIYPNRRSRGARGEGSRIKERIASKVTHVGLTRMVRRRLRGGKPGQYKEVRVECEVLACFEGSTGEDAARAFVKLYQRGATAAKNVACKADRPIPPPPPKPWTDGKATFHLIA